MTFLQSKVIKLITKRILNESFIIFFFFSRKYSTFIENVDFISYPDFPTFLFHFNLLLLTPLFVPYMHLSMRRNIPVFQQMSFVTGIGEKGKCILFPVSVLISPCE